LLQPRNLTPFIPPEFGTAGILRGATSCFFGYLGFDEISCLAGEAKNPQKNLPKGILYTLMLVTVLYIMAAITLTGMQPYSTISEVSGFPAAFQYHGWEWASNISAFGEIFTLPIVVLIVFMAQPRLQYALAMDGFLPSWFGELNSRGNLHNGTSFAGVIMILVATFVPFTHLNDMISAAVLVAFCMTNTSLILMWHEPPEDHPNLAMQLMGGFNVAAFAMSVLWTHSNGGFFGQTLVILAGVCGIACVVLLCKWCPQTASFGGSCMAYGGHDGYFHTPFMPITPCLGILVNTYLISQLELEGIAALLFYFCITTLFFVLTKRGSTQSLPYIRSIQELKSHEGREESANGELLLLRSISLPHPSSSSSLKSSA